MNIKSRQEHVNKLVSRKFLKYTFYENVSFNPNNSLSLPDFLLIQTYLHYEYLIPTTSRTRFLTIAILQYLLDLWEPCPWENNS